ncbi:MAG: CHAT domain-containing protein [Rhodocyclales bacterium]|nr:CHAT domain-containing protein [Rhodocyclales bacterium]
MTQETTSIELRIAGERRTDASGLPGWTAETYNIGGTARGMEPAVTNETLAPDAVLELELANGTRLLVAAEDAGRYLGTATGRGAGAAAAIEVGPMLWLAGPRAPTAAARDGLGAWALKSLGIYREGPAGMTALVAAGTFQDAALENRNGLYRCASDRLALSAIETMPAATEPNLLFIHGTASSTAGSFGNLWTNPDNLRRMVATYGPRIFAFEHRSLTESPVANALALIKTLPNGARLHIVSHSRGGMVGELLARANRSDGKPFTDDDIARFLEHAQRTGREGHEEDAVRLRELNRELVKRAIRVERFVRVACPARGTTLASGRLDRWASVMLNLVGKGLDSAGAAVPMLAPVAGGFGLLKSFLLAVVKERCNAKVLPGLEAMMPDSPLVELLNAPEVEIDAALHVVAGDFAGGSLLSWLGDCLSEVFYGGETDLVVNTPSMSGGARRRKGILQKAVRGAEVTHFSYFHRGESTQPLLAALEGKDDGFEVLDGPSKARISRGGKKPKPNAEAPIVLMLPGIMGSHLQIGNDRIWFDPINMWAGEMDRLTAGAKGVAPDGWMDRNYEDLADYLSESHEVRPFAYDWRLSITQEAERFGTVLDKAMDNALARGRPLRILAHSMGGLVARLALKDRWSAFKAIPGSRLLQLGTPNNGSHSIATVLMARDDFVQMIERWFDFRHDTKEFLEIVRDLPGVLELLPWPGEDGKAADGVDYFDAATWQAFYNGDQDSAKGECWVPPLKAPLDEARKAVAQISKAPLDAERTVYVAGCAQTPVAVRLSNGQVEIGWSERGDGRVPWTTGIPPGVPIWYVGAVHGDLASHEDAFAGYRELLERGDTTNSALSRTPRGTRDLAPPTFRARGLRGHALYPTSDELLAAATGGARPGRRGAVAETQAEVTIVHGNLASADAPVLIGAYANDSLRGTAKFLDGHLGGQLEQTLALGRYPTQPDHAMVFRHPNANGKPNGAIVVGLGAIGELTPGMLVQALCNGLLELARDARRCAATTGDRANEKDEDKDGLAASALLVGSGHLGLTVEVGASCLVEALCRANRRLADAGQRERIRRLTIYEESEDRAIAAALALRELATDPRHAATMRFDGRLRTGAGGYRGRCAASGGEPGAFRVHVVAEKDTGGLSFTVISDRARNEVSAEANQCRAVDGLIASATASTTDQPGISRALFELMVPNGMKEAVAEVRSLIMSVDIAAAAYPWELMRDTGNRDTEPLSARIELVRQLASKYGRGRVPLVADRRAFVVGDTQSGAAALPGAEEEARGVARLLRANAIGEVVDIYKADAGQVYQALFHDRYRFMHFAAHGVVNDKPGQSGMLLGPEPGSVLGPAQVAKLRHVPEFVFINCCHLGSMAADARPRWGELAAGLATQFIEMGCKAVIAAGWAVDDAAALTFAETFYQGMFSGSPFGMSVREARAATFRRHRGVNTWGAYQAYGDERYRFPDSRSESMGAEDYIHVSHLLADLDMLAARLQSATAADRKNYYRQRIEAIETASRKPGMQGAKVLDRLGRAWADLGDREKAIAHYRAALEMEDAEVRLKALEQLANLEIREGAALLDSGDKSAQEKGREHLDTGVDRLQRLMEIGVTVERGSLLASYWKHLALHEKRLRGEPSVDECLENMQLAYWKAAAQSAQRDGEWDYYPLLNFLDADFLLAARGNDTHFKAHQPELAWLLQAAIANAHRRFAEERNFFHAVAEIDAARVDALWACLDGRGAQALTNAAVCDGLAERYRALFGRMGAAGERDSALKQVRVFLKLLPDNPHSRKFSAALQRLLEGATQ